MEKAMGNHATVFTKHAWQLIDNKEKESMEKSVGNDVTTFIKNA